MKIAVQGCSHGELDNIYETIAHIEKENNFKIDLLLCCGDFQAVRNRSDLTCMSVPSNYRKMCSFYRYYSGEKTAPLLTIFIGGNHEATNYLGELAYGGWVCPNIYYLGYAGVIKIGGLRIGGISGIFKGHDYCKGHHEAPPYNENTKRSAYHIRSVDVFRLKQISDSLDVFLSHDWPRGIYYHGDIEELLRRKPFFKHDIECDRLGSQPTRELLEVLRPAYWFSAHLHVKFAALIPHDTEEGCDDVQNNKRVTKFLALDKCLPRRQHLQVIDIEPKESPPPDGHQQTLCYDDEWLCVLKSTNHLLNVTSRFQHMPASGGGGGERWDFRPTRQELDEIGEIFQQDFRVPFNFVQTVEPYDPLTSHQKWRNEQPELQLNPQTTEFCEKLGISDPFRLIHDWQCFRNVSVVNSSSAHNPDEVPLDSDDGELDADETNVVGELPLSKCGGAFLDVNAGRPKLTLPPPVSHVSESSLQHFDGDFSVATTSTLDDDPVTSSAVRDTDELDDEMVAATDQSIVSQNGACQTSVTTQQQEPPTKRFKRRNEAIYASVDDDQVTTSA